MGYGQLKRSSISLDGQEQYEGQRESERAREGERENESERAKATHATHTQTHTRARAHHTASTVRSRTLTIKIGRVSLHYFWLGLYLRLKHAKHNT